jgi:hypothetical protein
VVSIIVTLDVDGSADAIAAVRCSAGAGADFVKGSRFAHGGGGSDITGGLPLLEISWPGSATAVAESSALRRWLRTETSLNIRSAKASLTIWEVRRFERPRIHGQSNRNAIHDGL